MATQQNLVDELNTLNDQVQKIGTEITGLKQKVSDLEDAIAAGGEISPEVQIALDALKASIQVADDLVPDAPTP